MDLHQRNVGALAEKSREAEEVTSEPVSDTGSSQESLTTDSQGKTAAQRKRDKFWIRFVATWLMVGAFAVLCYAGHLALAALITIIQILMFSEIVNHGVEIRRERDLPGHRMLHWYWFATILFFVHGKNLIRQVGQLLDKESFHDFLHYHGFVSFSLYTMGFVIFVFSLKQNYIQYQFRQLAWSILTILYVVVQSSFIIANLFHGMVWFLLPALLIATNDTWAYMFGKFFGRTRLIKLSPNKTWEGFAGGTVMTFCFACVYAYVMIWYGGEALLCPKREFSFDWSTCDVEDVFVPRVYPQLAKGLTALGLSGYSAAQWVATIRIAPFQFHALSLALFASIFAPFGGFFASGFKRAFRIKDFAKMIPGHGGITDRMDCQILMGMFTYMYVRAFTRPSSYSLEEVLYAIHSLTQEDQAMVLEQLKIQLGL